MRPRRGFVDSSSVLAHVEAMIALGSECNVIDQHAGTREMTCWRLVNLRRPTMRSDSAEKLLALPVATYVSKRYRSERIELPEGVSHGTRTGYGLGCGCRECVNAKSRYKAKFERGETGYVPVDPVRSHIEGLVAAGCRPSWIAKASGVDYCTVYNIRKGRFATVQQAKAEALFAVRRVTFTDWQYIPAAPTLALVERMWRQGYSKVWISGRLGHCVPKPGQRFVRVFVARAVSELSEFVGDSAGVCQDGSSLYKRLAKTRRRDIPVNMRHGTLQGYNEGCRCDLCFSAHSRYMKARRKKAAA